MIKVQNIYYMLAYAYQSLSIGEAKRISPEKFDKADDLLASILLNGLIKQIKLGLCNDYVFEEEELKVPKGKIMLSKTVKNMARQKKELICINDNYVENTELNQILKTTAIILMKSKFVLKTNKQGLKKVLHYFSNVEEINPFNIRWKYLTYNKNNISYKLLINICYLVLEGMLMSDETGNIQLNEFIDNQRMSALYERFIFMYYRKHFPDYKVSRSQISWDTDDGIIDLLPKMKSDIMIETPKKTLIIDAKYYGDSLATNSMFGNKTIHSNNLYQIYAYVKNQQANQNKEVSGMLLYANTEGDNPDIEYQLGGNKISVKTLDLNCDFTHIASQLNSILLGWDN